MSAARPIKLSFAPVNTMKLLNGGRGDIKQVGMRDAHLLTAKSPHFLTSRYRLL